jgi:hypothetical protein
LISFNDIWVNRILKKTGFVKSNRSEAAQKNLTAENIEITEKTEMETTEGTENTDRKNPSPLCGRGRVRGYWNLVLEI